MKTDRSRTLFSVFRFQLAAVFLFAAFAHALTVNEIIALKKAGVGDETIRLLIERERDEKAMALRAGTWRLADGRVVYSTEGLAAVQAQYGQEAYPLCVYPVIEVPQHQGGGKKGQK